MIVAYVAVESRYGRLYVAEGPSGIVLARRRASAAEFERDVLAALGRAAVPAPDPEPQVALLQRWLEGDVPPEPRLDLDRLPPFARAALRKTAEIPFGEVRPYGWVAREMGQPTAARAVGSALARNPIDLLIPCQRVVRGDGSLGAYGRSGPAVKRALLEREGVDVDRLVAFARSGIRFLGDARARTVCYPTCRRAREAPPDDLVPFGSVDTALSDGYAACARCRPAQQ